jgi:hypothetical protein
MSLTRCVTCPASSQSSTEAGSIATRPGFFLGCGRSASVFDADAAIPLLLDSLQRPDSARSSS